MEIEIGDCYHIETGTDIFDIEVTELSTKTVTFMATGRTVKAPETPRVMPITVFAIWVRKIKATKRN